MYSKADALYHVKSKNDRLHIEIQSYMCWAHFWSAHYSPMSIYNVIQVCRTDVCDVLSGQSFPRPSKKFLRKLCNDKDSALSDCSGEVRVR